MKAVLSTGVLSAVVLAAVALHVRAQRADRATVPEATPQTRVAEQYARLPIAFEPRPGSTESPATFGARGSGYALSLAPTGGAVLAVRNDAGSPVTLRMTLDGANPRPTVTPGDELPGKVNYIIGNDPAQWRSNVPTYGRVTYATVYSGIDLVYYGNQHQLEYDFLVAPGADPAAIRMSWDGSDRITIDRDSGDLVFDVASEHVRLAKPVAYQIVEHGRREVAAEYTLSADRAVGFTLGAYDRQRPLVIDPVLQYLDLLRRRRAHGRRPLLQGG